MQLRQDPSRLESLDKVVESVTQQSPCEIRGYHSAPRRAAAGDPRLVGPGTALILGCHPETVQAKVPSEAMCRKADRATLFL